MSLLHLNGSNLIRLAVLGFLLAVLMLGFCSLLPSPRSTVWPVPSVTTDSASRALAREVDEWLPVSLSCRRTERFGS